MCRIKNTFQTLLVMLGAISLPIASPGAVNLVRNPGFEQDLPGNPPARYGVWKSDGSGGTSGVDDSVAFEGTKSLKIAGGAREISHLYPVPVKPGQVYRLSARAKQRGNGKSALAVYWQSPSGEWVWDAGTVKREFTGDGDWKLADAELTVPAGNIAKMVLILGVAEQSGSDDAVWFDDVRIERVTNQNMIANPGFEADSPGAPPAHYQLWQPDKNIGTSFVDDTVALEGKKSLKVSGAKEISYLYPIDVTPGQRFRLAARARQVGTGEMALAIYWQAPSGDWVWDAGTIKKEFSGNDEWKNIQMDLVVPEGNIAKMVVILGVANQSGSADAVWFDAIEVIEIIPENRVENSSFEKDAIGATPKGYTLWHPERHIGQSAVDDAWALDGGKSLKVAGAQEIGLQYPIAVEPGEFYQVEAWCRTVGMGEPLLGVYWQDAEGKWNWGAGVNHGKFIRDSNGWRRAVLNVQVPDSGVNKLVVVLTVTRQNSEKDAVWFDRISVKPSDPFVSQGATPTDRLAPLPTVISEDDFHLFKSNQDVLDTLRMGVLDFADTQWRPSVKVIRSQLEADLAVKKMRDYGYNAILTEGQRYLFSDSDDHPPYWDVLGGSLSFPRLVEINRYVADAAHRAGLKIYLHLTGNAVAEELVRSHPDWIARNIRDNSIDGAWGHRWACLNNPEYRSLFLERLDKLVAATGADGLMVDETTTMGDLCGCEHCRKKFTRDTQLTMPEPGVAWTGNINSPLYRSFLQWRMKNYLEINQEIRQVLRKHVPDGVILSYYASPYYDKAWRDHGASIEYAEKTNDILGLEAISDYHTYWPLFIANMKIIRAAIAKRDGEVFFLRGTWPYEDTYFSWILGLSQGAHQY